MKKRIFKWNRYIGMSFLFPFLIMVAILITRNVYPFGDESILHMDMYHQYAPFFAEFLHKLRNGESLFYSWNVGLGSNFLALFAYYLASPLNWLVVLFPEKYLLEFMTAMIVVKTALCGVTFYLYLRYHFKKENLAMVLCSCFYALSGFMAAYNWDIMWLDNVILAPLIILGLEKLFYEKKYFLYVVTLGISILSDYYLSIMICMFVVLWFVMLLLQEPKRQKQCIPFAGYSLLAGGLGAILLLPTYFALHFTDFGKFNFPKEITSYFSIFDMLARHFMNVATEQRLDHWPNIYCGVAVLILVPLFVLNKKVDLKEKLLKLGMMLFFLMSFTVNVLVFIWHGFNYPDSLPARQSFLYIFLVLVICYESFDKLDGVSLKALGGSFAGAFLFLLLCEKLYGYQSDFTLDSYYLTGLFLILYGVLLYVYMRYKQDTSWARYARFGKLFAVAAVCVVVLETEINMEDTSLTTTSRSSYLEDLESYENLVESVKESDPGFYRFEKWKTCD